MQRLSVNLDTRILAIDPGHVYTGLAIGENSKLQSACTVVSPCREESLMPGEMVNCLIRVLDSLGGCASFSAIVVEDYAMGAAHFNVLVPELVGILKYHFFHKLHRPIFMLSASAVRKATVAFGGASKGAVYSKMIPLLGHITVHGEENAPKERQFHATDAAAVYVAFCRYIQAGEFSKSFIRRCLV